jgi:hypothetical protein
MTIRGKQNSFFWQVGYENSSILRHPCSTAWTGHKDNDLLKVIVVIYVKYQHFKKEDIIANLN